MAQLKRYNGTSWETIGGSKAPKNTYTQNTTDTYSCDYINNVDKIYHCNEYTLLDYQDLLDIIQKMYDDYTNNINSIVYIAKAPEEARKGFYRIYEPEAGYYRLQQVYPGRTYKSPYNGETSLNEEYNFLSLSVSGGVVSITDFSNSTDSQIDKFLSTATNYGSTTYSPQYDGSPATKKYVDDSIVQSDWSQTTTTAKDYIKNKPTIPTVNNATLTIQKNGSSVATFTANASSNATANITVPTIKTSKTTSGSDAYSCTYINNTRGYSTNEVNTGSTWIDGKIIYRRVLTYNSPFVQRQTLSFSSITNFKEYTKIEGLLYRSDGYTLPLPTGNIIDDWTSVMYDFNSSSFGLYIGNELLNKTSKIVVIIEYTKTS